MALIKMTGRKGAWAIGLEGKASAMVVFVPGVNPIKDEIWYGGKKIVKVPKLDDNGKEIMDDRNKPVMVDGEITEGGISNHPDVKKALANKTLSVIKDKDNNDVKPSARKDGLPETLGRLDVETSIGIVKVCAEEKALERWSNNEKRPDVVKAIEAQIDIVKKLVKTDKVKS